MRRVVGVCALLAVAGCATLQGGSENSAWATVRVTPDSLLRIAQTQLEHHGFEVRQLGDNALITVPRTVPDYLIEVSRERPRPQQWFVRVNVDRLMLSGASRVEVIGYLMPDGQAQNVAAGSRQHAVPITAEDRRLFNEVRTVAGWIADAGKRAKK